MSHHQGWLSRCVVDVCLYEAHSSLVQGRLRGGVTSWRNADSSQHCSRRGTNGVRNNSLPHQRHLFCVGTFRGEGSLVVSKDPGQGRAVRFTTNVLRNPSMEQIRETLRPLCAESFLMIHTTITANEACYIWHLSLRCLWSVKDYRLQKPSRKSWLEGKAIFHAAQRADATLPQLLKWQ
jgi:hypothetical protein